MILWLISLTTVWASGLLHVPAFGPWCDYSHPRTESIGTDNIFGENPVVITYDDVDTPWAPPTHQCPQYKPTADSQHHHTDLEGSAIAGHSGPALLLQAFLIAVPVSVWSGSYLSVAGPAIRRRVTAVAIVAAIGLGAWALIAFVVGSTRLGLAYASIALALGTLATAYRGLHRDSVRRRGRQPTNAVRD